jgi:hypothetical protein
VNALMNGVIGTVVDCDNGGSDNCTPLTLGRQSLQRRVLLL